MNDSEFSHVNLVQPVNRKKSSRTIWCLLCCGLCPCYKSHIYGAVQGGTSSVENSVNLSDLGDDLDEDSSMFMIGDAIDGSDGSDDGSGSEGDSDSAMSDDYQEAIEQRNADAETLVDELITCLQEGDMLEGILSQTELKLVYEPIGAEGVRRLCKALEDDQRILSLEFGIRTIGKKGSTAALRYLGALLEVNTTLQTLSIWGDGVTASGVAALSSGLLPSHNSTLTHLNLGNNEIDDKGATLLADVLKHSKTLQSLDISGNTKIGDAGVINLCAALKANSTLEHLNLSSNSITTASAENLANLISDPDTAMVLQTLDISANQIDDTGICLIASALDRNSSLTQINLHGNDLGERGRKLIQQALQGSQQRAITIEDPNT